MRTTTDIEEVRIQLLTNLIRNTIEKVLTLAEDGKEHDSVTERMTDPEFRAYVLGRLVTAEILFEGHCEELYVSDCDTLSRKFDRARELLKAL